MPYMHVCVRSGAAQCGVAWHSVVWCDVRVGACALACVLLTGDGGLCSYGLYSYGPRSFGVLLIGNCGFTISFADVERPALEVTVKLDHEIDTTTVRWLRLARGDRLVYP